MKLFSQTSLLVMALGIMLGGFTLVNAETHIPTNSLIKGESNRTVYYYSEDGKRYVFPNEKTYKTWFKSFDEVIGISDEELSAIPLGGNVRYKPGVFLVKITTDPKVYAVSGNGRLRWVKTESIAKALYGNSWNLLIDDVPDPFFVNYSVDDPIEDDEEFDPVEEEDAVFTIASNRKAVKKFIKKVKTNARQCTNLQRQYNRLQDRLGNLGIEINDLGDNFVRRCVTSSIDEEDHDGDEDDDDVFRNGKALVCHVSRGNDKKKTIRVGKSAVRAHLAHGDELGRCDRDDDDDDDDTPTDTTAPVISDKTATVSTTTATITWSTNEEANSVVMYATTSLNDTSSTATTITNSTLITSHSVEINGLTASTTYFYIVKSTDASDNTATSTEMTFTTNPEVIVDTTAPVISDILATATSTVATITWATDESATSKVTWAGSSLDSASSTDMVSSDAFVTSHSLELTDLATSTEYFFTVESKDASDNTATSTEDSFISAS